MAETGPALAASAIPVRNLWHLLLYAWDLARYRDRWSAAAEEAPSLRGLLARVLADAVADLLKRGLGRGFVPAAREVRGIRGRVDFARSLKGLSLPRGRTHCRFDELGIDTLANRILRSTLVRLARDPRLAADAAKARGLRRDLADLAHGLDGVALVEPAPDLFSRLRIGRNDADYALAMNVCRLVHRLEMPTEERGPLAIAALLHEEILRHRLFERAILNFYRLHLGDVFDASSEMLAWPDAFACSYLPAMRTDITLRSRRKPARRIVVDAKFWEEALAASPFGAPAFRPAHLYQIYAYLRSQDEASAADRRASGILLYPAAGADLDEHMLVQGHRIRVATVDLGAPWPAIEERLLDVVLHWPPPPER